MYMIQTSKVVEVFTRLDGATSAKNKGSTFQFRGPHDAHFWQGKGSPSRGGLYLRVDLRMCTCVSAHRASPSSSPITTTFTTSPHPPPGRVAHHSCTFIPGAVLVHLITGFYTASPLPQLAHLVLRLTNSCLQTLNVLKDLHTDQPKPCQLDEHCLTHPSWPWRR